MSAESGHSSFEMQKSGPSDTELLAEWLEHRRERAFHRLVSRYAGLVLMTAKRSCGDASMAAEASQLTFLLLARKARSLLSCASLGGWLHRATLMHSRNLLRTARRETRKRHSLQNLMAASSSSPAPGSWADLGPALDESLAALSGADREAILLRYYRALSVREVAGTLGIAPDAAQKRIERATFRLRGQLNRRGWEAGGSLAAVMLAGFAADVNAAAPAVAALAAEVSAAAAPAAAGFTATGKSCFQIRAACRRRGGGSLGDRTTSRHRPIGGGKSRRAGAATVPADIPRRLTRRIRVGPVAAGLAGNRPTVTLGRRRGRLPQYYLGGGRGLSRHEPGGADRLLG